MEVIAIADRKDYWRWEIRHQGKVSKESRASFAELAAPRRLLSRARLSAIDDCLRCPWMSGSIRLRQGGQCDDGAYDAALRC